ncbi:MAG: chitobiase/beta-hexosaminidase C-terminal domain-containing protein [Magnetococcales bacterium]|nr:chitobiase/beta-hexosaminidase C-terminal domain-containing protein [Magnetococcales bacterium]
MKGVFVRFIGALLFLFSSTVQAAWIVSDSGTTDSLNEIAYGDGLYMAVGGSGAVITSEDLEVWTQQSSGEDNGLSTVAYGNGNWVSGGGWYPSDQSLIYSTDDGVNWAGANATERYGITSLRYINGEFIGTTFQGYIMASADGATWTDRGNATGSTVHEITYGDGWYAVAGYGGKLGMSQSTSGPWITRTPSSTSSYGAAFGNGRFVMVGGNGDIWTATPGGEWASTTSGVDVSLSDVIFADDRFVAVGQEGTILSSTDGVNWSAEESGITEEWLGGIVHDGTRFIIVGQDGTLLLEKLESLPTASDDSLSVTEDIAASGTLSGEDPAGGDLTFAIVSQGSLGTVSLTGSTGAYTYTPTPDAYGADSFTFNVTNDTGTSSAAAITVTITGVDDSPTISGSPETEAYEEEVYRFTPVGEDVDGDTLFFAIENQPEWASFNTANGSLTGRPMVENVGTTADIVISLTAGGETVYLDAFDLTVVATSLPTPDVVTGGLFNQPQSIALSCNDSASPCASIYYTLDGTDPTTSATRQLYVEGDPILLEESVTLQYVAMDESGNAGEVQSQAFDIDLIPPSLSVAEPLEGAILDYIYLIEGAVEDEGSGVAEVRLLLSDGSYFVEGDEQFAGWDDDEPDPWPLVEDDSDDGDWSEWEYSLGIGLHNGDYTLTVAALDQAGNTATVGPYLFTIHDGDAYPTALSIALTSNAILPDETVSGTGLLQRVGSSDSDLSGMTITFTVTDPDGSVVATEETETDGSDGRFAIPELSGFGEEGYYTIEASFAGNALLMASDGSATLYVGPSAGYAIIVEGKIDSEEGLESHNLTTNRIYNHFIDRGFKGDDIQYFNYDTDQEGVTELPSKAGIEEAITDWALAKMTDIPAPLFVVMVDHGSINRFHLDDESITPDELDAWLDTLEAGLAVSNPDALAQERVVIIGACYSGSFVESVSKSGRVMVTCAADDEVSYKGALVQPDTDADPEGTPVRVGEFFLEELFGELSQGVTLKDAFRTATESTETYTRGSSSSANSRSPLDDGARQHPQLDDNGDGVSSNDLDDAQVEDGEVAEGLYLGGEGSHLTNSALVPAEIEAVTETLYLTATDSSGELWLTTNDDSEVAWGWVEIREPGKVLESADGTETGQVDPDLPWEFLDLGSNGIWQLSYNGFSDAGQYEIYYYVQDLETLDTSPMQRSVVYKNQSGNSAPGSFNLTSPPTLPQTVRTVGVFEWQAAIDPDGDGVTYNLIIATDYGFTNEVYRAEALWTPQAFVGISAGLEDLTHYYWKVEAVDGYGAMTTSGRWSFQTDNTNDLLGTLTGYIYDEESQEGVVGATILAVGGDGSTVTAESSEPYGGFVLSQLPGDVALTVSADGYGDQSLSITLPELDAVQSNIALAKTGSSDQSATFADVPTDRWGWSYIETLAENAITSGCDSDIYCPDNELQRSEMAISPVCSNKAW